ncbi:hypothetical protein AKJ16_DCAP20096 [Drosera capensis]
MVMRTSPTWSQAQNEAQSKMEQGQAQSLSKEALWHSSLAELERSLASSEIQLTGAELLTYRAYV